LYLSFVKGRDFKMSDFDREPSDNDRGPARETPVIRDRRKKNDLVVVLASALSVVCWILALAVWLFLDQASPDKVNVFSTWRNVLVRNYWDSMLLSTAFRLLLASVCISIIAFVCNLLRMKRKTDKYKKSIIIIGAVTIIGTVIFIIRFGWVPLW